MSKSMYGSVQTGFYLNFKILYPPLQEAIPIMHAIEALLAWRRY